MIKKFGNIKLIKYYIYNLKLIKIKKKGRKKI